MITPNDRQPTPYTLGIPLILLGTLTTLASIGPKTPTLQTAGFGTLAQYAKPVLAFKTCIPTGTVVVMDADGRHRTTVIGEAITSNVFSDPSWSPDGQSLAFIAQLQTGQKGLYVYHLYKKSLTLLCLVHGDGQALWCPKPLIDSAPLIDQPPQSHLYIAYTDTPFDDRSKNPGLHDIFLIRSDGYGTALNLTNTPLTDETLLDWSPDASALLSFNKTFPGQPNADAPNPIEAVMINTLGFDDQQPLRLTSVSKLHADSVFDQVATVDERWVQTPDQNEHIAFSVGLRIYATNRSANPPDYFRVISDLPGEETIMCWSPEGTHVLFMDDNGPVTKKTWRLKHTPTLYRMNLKTRERTVIAEGIRPIRIDWWRNNNQQIKENSRN